VPTASSIAWAADRRFL